MSVLSAFREVDRITAASAGVADVLAQIDNTQPPTTTPTFAVVHKSDIPDRQRQLARVTEFFGQFLAENKNLEKLGGTCTMFLIKHERGKRGVTGMIKILRPSTEGGLRIKVQVDGSGDCTLHSVIFSEFAGTENELYELLVEGNGGSNTWPNREQGQRPQHSDGEHGTALINRTKLRGRLRQNGDDLNELLEALDLYVSSGNRRVTPSVLQSALEMAFKLSMKHDADYMHIIRWLHDAGHLTRENGETYMLPERATFEPEENLEDAAETKDAVEETPTEQVVAEPAPATVDLKTYLGSLKQLAEEHKAREVRREELVARINQLLTEEQATALSIPRVEAHIADLQHNLDELRKSLQAINAEQEDLESQVSKLEAESAEYAAVAEQIKELASIIGS